MKFLPCRRHLDGASRVSLAAPCSTHAVPPHHRRSRPQTASQINCRRVRDSQANVLEGFFSQPQFGAILAAEAALQVGVEARCAPGARFRARFALLGCCRFSGPPGQDLCRLHAAGLAATFPANPLPTTALDPAPLAPSPSPCPDRDRRVRRPRLQHRPTQRNAVGRVPCHGRHLAARPRRPAPGAHSWGAPRAIARGWHPEQRAAVSRAVGARRESSAGRALRGCPVFLGPAAFT
jgi:hypothetical protein